MADDKKQLPAAKRCEDESSDLFGSVAVASDLVKGYPWMVATPGNGGHHASDDEVKDWKAIP